MTINENLIKKLPARKIADEVNLRLQHHTRLVVTAPPGAGKSTLLPLTILERMEGKVLMLEPRRLAAKQIAERMAELIGEKVGKTVGYRVRFESQVSDKTRIEVLTEGILTRMLVNDPTLEGVSAVIFDEFHERSLVSDLALALTREAQEVVRPDLRIILMSATIDTQQLCQSLDSPLVESEGKMFDVKVVHLPREDESKTTDAVAHDVARAVMKAHREEQGDILAFLPGQAEILRCKELLGGSLGETQVMPLYGLLSSEDQRRAIQPSTVGLRKVVLATNIAETSLTIEGVRIVIDCGLQRKLVFEPRTEMSHLRTVPISMDMARQRSGRAGRLTEGICYRLWSKAQEHRMAECRQPELLEADLSSLVLDIAAWGEPNPMRLPWLTTPPQRSIHQATKLLQLLGAIDEKGKITPFGGRMADMACHPRIARMLLTAKTPEEKALAADIAALMEERDPMSTKGVNDHNMGTWGNQPSADINLRLILMREQRRKRLKGGMERLLRVSEEYRRTVRVQENNNDLAPIDTGRLLALAYPERIAMAIDKLGNFRMANGMNVKVEGNDELSAYSWLSIAQLNAESGRIFLASTVKEADLKNLSQTIERLSWDCKKGCLLCQQEQRIGVLILDSKPLQTTRDKLVDALCMAAKDYGESMLDFNPQVQQLQNRIAQVAQWHPELNLPDLATQAVLQQSEKWLPFYLENNGHLANTIADLKRINLCEGLWSLLTYEQQLEVERLAPSHITVPTGSRIRLDYRQGAEAPVLSVRLQECFGLTDTPCVNDGKLPVLMELLSPGFKPVQLTRDLKNFWADTYFEVRKELRRRYPKHFWPDNPLDADPTRGIKKKG